MGYPKGLLALFGEYMDSRGWREEQKAEIMKYCTFLQARARGRLPTAAAWIREFVAKHPDYQKDSIITQKMSCDLLRELRQANEPGSAAAQALLGGYAGAGELYEATPQPEYCGCTLF